MKLYDLAEQTINDVTRFTNRTIVFSLSNDEGCTIQTVESGLDPYGNGPIWKLYVNVILEHQPPVIRPEIFNEIIEGYIHFLTNTNIHKFPALERLNISLFEIEIYPGHSKFNLFPYLQPALANEIKKPRKLHQLIEHGLDLDLTNVSLPKIDPDYNTDYINIENKANNLFKALKKGKIDGVPYELDDYIKLMIDPVKRRFSYDNNTIHPDFKITIFSHDPEIDYPDDIKGKPIYQDQYDQLIKRVLQEKFSNYEITLLF